MKNILIALALAMVALDVRAERPPVDPVVGRWHPTNGHPPILLEADGAASDQNQKGKWDCLTPNETPRKYRVTWDRFVDTLSLLNDGKELVGENQDGLKLRWIRLSDEPKADPLRLALTSSNWSWENTDGGTKSYEEIQFYQDGVARNPRFFTARWEITGPRTVVLENTNFGTRNNGKKAYLVFDAAFVHFVGFDFNGRTIVEGFRREALDPNRSSSEPRLK